MSSNEAPSPHPTPPRGANAARAHLRTIATPAHHGGKALRDASEGFGDFSDAKGSRTPVQILAHMGDRKEWAPRMARGEHRW